MPDQYLYPNSDVLINKFNIQDADRLAEVENDLVYIKLFEIDEIMSSLTFNANGLKDLHRYLFEDVYDWAGQFRTINIYKYERVLPGTSVEYGEHTRLQKELDAAFTDMNAIEWKKLSAHEQAKPLQECLRVSGRYIHFVRKTHVPLPHSCLDMPIITA